MPALLRPLDNESPGQKKEQFVQIGKNRVRIANDHHAILSDIKDDFREMNMEQLLFLTSFIGASLLQVFGPMTLRNVRKSAQRKSQ